MWKCPECKQEFLHKGQSHSCADKTLDDFLRGKSDHTIDLFNYFIEQYRSFADFKLHPAKTRIAFASNIRFAYVHRLGKDFIDIVFQFRKACTDNFCFYKIARIPGTEKYNHYCRLYRIEDLTEEIKQFMKIAYEESKRTEKK
jgi:hypothetical protein